MDTPDIDRRKFLEQSAAAGAALTLSGAILPGRAAAQQDAAKDAFASASSAAAAFRHRYLPHLAEVPVTPSGQHVRHHPRARRATRRRNSTSPNHYPHIDKMLAGVRVRPAGQPDRHAGARASQPRGDRRRQARLEREADRQFARRRAGVSRAGQERKACGCGARRSSSPARNSRSWPRRSPPASSAASPRPMPTTGTPGPTGRRSSTRKAAAACPTWASTTSPASPACWARPESVVAMVSIVTPTRKIDGKGEIKVTEEDNAMVLLDHGNGVLSHVQCGFNFFNPARPRRQQGDPAHDLDRRLEGQHGAGGLRLGAAGRRSGDREEARLRAARHGRRRLRLAAGRVARVRMPGHGQRTALHAGARAARGGDHRRRARIAARPAGGSISKSTFKWPIVA